MTKEQLPVNPRPLLTDSQILRIVEDGMFLIGDGVTGAGVGTVGGITAAIVLGTGIEITLMLPAIGMLGGFGVGTITGGAKAIWHAYHRQRQQ